MDQQAPREGARERALRDSLMTPEDVASELGISARRVRALAKARNVGWHPTRAIWLFLPDDVDRLRSRRPGRPRRE